MISHHLLTLYRSVMRHRLYAALNVFGLAVGVAVFLVLWLDVRFETSFERWIPRAQQIYQVRSLQRDPGQPNQEDGITMGAALEELRGDYPQIVGTRVWDPGAIVRYGAEVTSERVQVVDSTFFRVFDLPLLKGDRATALTVPDGLILTQSKAKRYFGNRNPIGQRLTLTLANITQTYRIVGVLRDPPRSTDLKFDFLVPITPRMIAPEQRWRDWGAQQLSTYLRFSSGPEAAGFASNLDSFVDRHAVGLGPGPAHTHLALTLRPLLSLHLLSPVDKAAVATLGLVGLLTLILGAVNYVNLATAQAGLRAREVALRKIMGATPQALFSQFMTEALLNAAVSALIGLALCELALPLVNAAGGLALTFDYFSLDGPLPMVLIAVLALGLGCGFYPASILAAFQPAQVLASTRAPGGGRSGLRIREALVLFQFAVAVAFTIATFVIVAQMHYLRNADLGFRRDGLIVVSSFDDDAITPAQQANLLEAWKRLPGVVADTVADIAPGNKDSTDDTHIKRLGAAGVGPDLDYVQITPGFFEVYGARLLAGRALSLEHGADRGPPTGPPLQAPGMPPPLRNPLRPEERPIRNVIVNEAAVAILGFHTAHQAVGASLLEQIGTRGFQRLTIAGVIHDIRFRSPHDPVPPTVYYFDTTAFNTEVAAVRFSEAAPATIIERLRRTWGQIVPGIPFRAQTGAANLEPYYRPDDQRGRLFIIGAALAVGIGCVGLYGLASFNTAQRVREIGIRKTLGASTGDVLRLLLIQLLRPVFLANLIAWPLAWLTMRAWLAGFDQRVALSPLYFLAATGITMLVAAGTVTGHAATVARAEPAKALRHD
ncbi:ABC transporter permease [Caulobacter sp. S45]|uniref:ABC transporter permease n=1 Tax=Caulobacter sp. S45 TaxID=1641861 RepID=UPI00131D557D|nr:ABC transporter permease [Caulobacter sp. S45]